MSMRLQCLRKIILKLNTKATPVISETTISFKCLLSKDDFVLLCIMMKTERSNEPQQETTARLNMSVLTEIERKFLNEYIYHRWFIENVLGSGWIKPTSTL